MEKNLEIKKLDDIIEWADSIIRAAGYNEEKYKSDSATAYCHVKAYELWRIRDVALESMERHTVYTNALNKDIADKAAKIDLLEKEIEGRKAGYVALKTQMDTKYISIEEHDMINKSLDEKVEIYEKEIERLNRYTTNLETANNNLVTRVASLESGKVAELEKELADCKVKIRHQKENLDGINKTLEIRTKENERLIAVKNNQEKEIEAHESENARLTEKITSLKNAITELSHEIDNYKSWNADLHRDIKSEINGKNDLVDAYEKKYDEFEKKIAELERQNSTLDGIIKGYWDELKKKEDDHGRTGFKKYIEWLIEEEERAVPERFKARLNEEITAIFEKEEETEVKGNGRTSSGRYPWGAKVNDIPCGEDSIE